MSAYEQPYTIPNVTLKRVDDQLCVSLEQAEKGSYQLLKGSQPNLSSINEVIAGSESGYFEVELPVNQGPYYFVIKNESQQTNIFSERVIRLNQAINFRDMGGYRTNDGRFTRWGCLFRSDQLSKLDEADVQLLERMGLKTIIDYRSDHERNINPNKEIATVTQTIHCDPQSSFSEAAANAVDLNEENVKLVQQLENGKVDEKYINGKGENVIEDYQDLVTSEAAKQAYRKFLQACANVENVPLVHHCRGGKDRTGLGSMFLLLLLNVTEEEIIRDYVLTGIIRKERNQLKYELYKELTDNEDYLAYLMAMIETREEFIRASIDRVKELYPSIETYFIEHFGITEEQIQEMRAFYLEEGAEQCQE